MELEETDGQVESNVQHLDVDRVWVKIEQDVKTETPTKYYGQHTDACLKIEQETSNESYSLHADVCVTNEQDIKTETSVESCGLHSDVYVEIEREISDESYGLHSDVCVKTEQDIKTETPDESYGRHTDVCVKDELETSTENPVDLCVQHQHGDAIAETNTHNTLCVKNEYEEQDDNVLHHPQFCDGNVKVKCEEKIKAVISSVTLLKTLQSEEPCHVYNGSDDGCKKEEAESDPDCPVQLESLGLHKTDAGVDTGQIVSYFHTALKQELPSSQKQAEPKIEIDMADTDSVGGDGDDDGVTMGGKDVHTGNVHTGDIHTGDIHMGDVHTESVSAKAEGTTTTRQSNQHEHAHACNVCGKTFPYRSLLMRHSRIHTREEPYKCGVCYKEFGYSQQLLTHKRTVHTGDIYRFRSPRGCRKM